MSRQILGSTALPLAGHALQSMKLDAAEGVLTGSRSTWAVAVDASDRVLNADVLDHLPRARIAHLLQRLQACTALHVHLGTATRSSLTTFAVKSIAPLPLAILGYDVKSSMALLLCSVCSWVR